MTREVAICATCCDWVDLDRGLHETVDTYNDLGEIVETHHYCADCAYVRTLGRDDDGDRDVLDMFEGLDDGYYSTERDE